MSDQATPFSDHLTSLVDVCEDQAFLSGVRESLCDADLRLLLCRVVTEHLQAIQRASWVAEFGPTSDPEPYEPDDGELHDFIDRYWTRFHAQHHRVEGIKVALLPTPTACSCCGAPIDFESLPLVEKNGGVSTFPEANIAYEHRNHSCGSTLAREIPIPESVAARTAAVAPAAPLHPQQEHQSTPAASNPPVVNSDGPVNPLRPGSLIGSMHEQFDEMFGKGRGVL